MSEATSQVLAIEDGDKGIKVSFPLIGICGVLGIWGWWISDAMIDEKAATKVACSERDDIRRAAERSGEEIRVQYAQICVQLAELRAIALRQVTEQDD